MNELCSFCEKKPRRSATAELCSACYMRKRRKGTLEYTRTEPKPEHCQHDCGCTNKVHARNLCSSHYRQLINNELGPCEYVDDETGERCTNQRVNSKLCSTHWRWQTFGRPQKPTPKQGGGKQETVVPTKPGPGGCKRCHGLGSVERSSMSHDELAAQHTVEDWMPPRMRKGFVSADCPVCRPTQVPLAG